MVLAGHSMGAFVAVHAAHDRPDLFSHVVLVDGGVALPFPDGADPDEVLDRTLGPAIDRLGRTYPSVDAYVDVFRQHPAMAPTWDEAMEAYARYDTLETADGVRPRAREDAVRADGRDLLVSGREYEPERPGDEVARCRSWPRRTACSASPAGCSRWTGWRRTTTSTTWQSRRCPA